MVPSISNQYLPGVVQIPSSLTLLALTKAYPAIATVSVNAVTEANTYIPGQSIKLSIPVTYGMFQADGLTPTILSVSGNDLTLDLNTIEFDLFTVPTGSNYQVATIAPNGSRNLQISNETAQVPFQSLNDIGN